MSKRLAELVESVFERAEIDELGQVVALDELLAELAGLARTPELAGLIDDLLDYRVVVVDRDAAEGAVAA